MGITVFGVGEASGTPDTVELDVGVSVFSATVAEATATAATGGQAVISALISRGVAEADIVTTDHTIHPEFDYSGKEQRLTGYRVGNTVHARLGDVSRAGELIDAASAAAGDDARVNGLTFRVDNDAELQAEARETAWNDAVTKATHLATLSGQTLRLAVSIKETARSPVLPIRMMADTAMAREPTTPIQPGSSTITVTLEVEFAVES